MKIGDTVKTIKGNQLGLVGGVIFKATYIPRNNAASAKYSIRAEDGTTFEAMEDELVVVTT